MSAINDVNNFQTEVIRHGLLYNAYVAYDVRNIANTGWHISTHADGITLLEYLRINGYSYDGTIPVNYSKLAKSMAKVGVWYPHNTCAYNPGTAYCNDYPDKANLSKFNATPGGYRYYNGSFLYPSEFWIYFQIWLIEGPSHPNYEHYLKIDNINAVVTTYSGGVINQPLTSMSFGRGIRLVKDSTTLTHGQTGLYIGNDGRTYDTICIGTQEWLSDNLCETKYRNGDVIPEVTDNTTWANLTTGALCVWENDWDNI